MSACFGRVLSTSALASTFFACAGPVSTASSPAASTARTQILFMTGSLWQRVQVRADGAGEAAAVGDVPVDGPRHRAANVRIGTRVLERAASGAFGEAVERAGDRRRRDDPAARRARSGRQPQRHLV